jgi:hypothetical protein
LFVSLHALSCLYRVRQQEGSGGRTHTVQRVVPNGFPGGGSRTRIRIHHPAYVPAHTERPGYLLLGNWAALQLHAASAERCITGALLNSTDGSRRRRCCVGPASGWLATGGGQALGRHCHHVARCVPLAWQEWPLAHTQWAWWRSRVPTCACRLRPGLVWPRNGCQDALWLCCYLCS